MSVLESGERKEAQCPECGNQYKSIGHHWSRGSCDRPDFSDKQLELIKGLNLGDGNIDDRDSGKSYFRVGSTNPEFLDWLDHQFGILSTGVRLDRDKEQSASYAQQGKVGGMRFQGPVYPQITVPSHAR